MKTTNPKIKKIVRVFGGHSALGKLLGILPSAVANWKRVPSWHILPMLRHARRNKLPINVNDLVGL
jgi:hypothetical protein